MNFFSTKTIWSNIEIWFFKVSVFSSGVIIGSFFN